MPYIPLEIARHIPGLRETRQDADPWVQCRISCPDQEWDFFVTEFDPEEGVCYGRQIGPGGTDEFVDLFLARLDSAGIEYYCDPDWMATRASQCAVGMARC